MEMSIRLTILFNSFFPFSFSFFFLLFFFFFFFLTFSPIHSFSSTNLQGRLKGSDTIVAVKILSLEEDQDLEGIRKEINILFECDNPNIVKYFGSYFKDERLWVTNHFLLSLCIMLSLCE